MEREKFEIATAEGRFVFNAKPQIFEEMQIKNKMAELLGGIDKVSEFEVAIANAYQKHEDFLKKKFGDELERKREELQVLANDKDKIDEYIKLGNELYSGNTYFVFANLQREFNQLYDYGFAIVMCVEKPKDFDFEKQSESKMKEIVKLIRKSTESSKKKLQSSEGLQL